MKKIVPILLIVAMAGCASHATMKSYDKDPALLDKANAFYSFLVDRENGIRHNDLAPEFRKFFADNEAYYGFMDSLMFTLRQRNIYRNTISHYYIQGIEESEDGKTAKVKVKFLSRDAYMLYRKVEATQEWEKAYDVWYPRKIEAPKQNKFEKYTEMYAVPPLH